MQVQKLILCVGNEGTLLDTRRRVVESAGASVVTAASCAEASVSARRHCLAAVIIGHGFDRDEQEWIEGAVRAARGAISVLQLPVGVVSPELLVKFVLGVPDREA